MSEAIRTESISIDKKIVTGRSAPDIRGTVELYEELPGIQGFHSKHINFQVDDYVIHFDFFQILSDPVVCFPRMDSSNKMYGRPTFKYYYSAGNYAVNKLDGNYATLEEECGLDSMAR